jgi:hypothetical protein
MKNIYKKNGFAHPFILLILLGILGISLFFVLRVFRDSPIEQSFDIYDDDSVALVEQVMGEVSGITTMIPTSQIVAIPKNECTLFVTKQGNDSNNGRTEQTAFAKITKGVSAMIPGDRLCIGGGAYREVVGIRKIGTADKPFVIGGYVGGGLPIIDGGISQGNEYTLPDPKCKIVDTCAVGNGDCRKHHGCRWDVLVGLGGSRHVQLKGIDIRGSSGRGLSFSDASDILIQGVRSYHNWSAGINIGGTEKDTNIHVDLSAVFDNSRAYPENKKIGGGALHVAKTTGTKVTRTLVFRNFGEGLDVHKGAADTLVENNLFWDNAHTSLYANGSTDAHFNKNFLFCTGKRTEWLETNGVGNDGHGSAVTIRNEEGVTQTHGEGRGTVVTNNTIVGCSGSVIIAAQKSAKLDDVTVVNNTIVSPRSYPKTPKYPGKGGEGIRLGAGSGTSISNLTIANNVIHVNPNEPNVDSIKGSGANFANNYVSKAASVNNAGIKVMDLKISKTVGATEYLDPAKIKPGDYVIAQGSPAIGGANKLNSISGKLATDLFGNSRPGTSIDAGSYAFGGSKNWNNLYEMVLGDPDDVVVEPPIDDEEPPIDDEEPPVIVDPAPDTDGDGISDDIDECPNEHAGDFPDADRPGCPAPEEEIEDPQCGNGLVETGEVCDLGAGNGACPSTCNNQCRANSCGVTPPTGGSIKLTPTLWKVNGNKIINKTVARLVTIKGVPTNLEDVILVLIPSYPSSKNVYLYQMAKKYSIQANTNYTLKFKARVYGNVSPSISVIMTDNDIANNKDIKYQATQVKTNTDWTEYAITFKSKKVITGSTKLGLKITGSGSNRLLLHNLTLTK